MNIGDYVLVRCDRAGVFAGNLAKREGQEVTLNNCRRIWYWDGACSISQIAKDGVARPQKCKFTVTVDEILLLDAIEVIPCTATAEISIKGVPEWKI